MIADGIFISKLSYLISVWGGCEGYLARSFQIIQNKVARLVTKKSWYTPVKILLAECGWLQATSAQSSVQTTRQALQGVIKPSPGRSVARQELTAQSFRIRAVHEYNLLPVEIREVTSPDIFKKSAKKWIMENIPID